MKRSVIAALFALTACSVPIEQPATASNPAVTRLDLAGHAKRYCSGIRVSERERAEAFALTRPHVPRVRSAWLSGEGRGLQVAVRLGLISFT